MSDDDLLTMTKAELAAYCNESFANGAKAALEAVTEFTAAFGERIKDDPAATQDAE